MYLAPSYKVDHPKSQIHLRQDCLFILHAVNLCNNSLCGRNAGFDKLSPENLTISFY